MSTPPRDMMVPRGHMENMMRASLEQGRAEGFALGLLTGLGLVLLVLL